MKKKIAETSFITYELNLPVYYNECPDKTVEELLQNVLSETTVGNLQKFIKDLGDILKENPIEKVANYIYDMLAFLFISFDSKCNIKKTLTRVLLNADIFLVEASIGKNIAEAIQGATSKSLAEKNNIIINLQTCASIQKDDMKPVIMELHTILPFCIDYFVQLTIVLNGKSINEDVLGYLATLVKFFLSVLMEERTETELKTQGDRVIATCYKIIMNEFVPFEVKCNVSQIMVQSMNNLPVDVDSKYIFKIPCLQLLNNECDVISHFDISNNEVAKLSVYTAILLLVPGEKLSEEKIDGIPTISYLFLNILDIAKRSSGIPSQVIVVMKTLGVLSKSLKFLPKSHLEKLFRLGIEYIWANLDHHIDTVRCLARDVFRNFIKLAVSYGYSVKGDTALIKMVLTYLSEVLLGQSSNYIALNILAEETGIWFVLQYFENLPTILLMKMKDVSLANSVCTTYEALMRQHDSQRDDNEIWLETWIEILKPFLKKSEPPITAYYQKLLTAGFQINPSVINTIIHYQDSNCPNEIGALFSCIRWARRNMSSLKSCQSDKKCSQESTLLWRQLIDPKILELNMCHQSDEVRIHALAIVVECQKTTEIFTKWELDYIIEFFKYNATTQDPNTTQQIKMLYKKAILRIRDGGLALKRSIAAIEQKGGNSEDMHKKLDPLSVQEDNYFKFFDRFIEEHLKKGLQPWANMYRRALCLELLAYIQDFLPPSIYQRNFNPNDIKPLYKLLDDSYESNINLASIIIKKIAPDHHQSVDEAINSIKIVLEKATSLNVSASLSAAYYLSLVLGSSFAREALQTLTDNKVETSDVLLLVIHLLIGRIEKELRIAKENILTGARNAPFYGLLYCIRKLIETKFNDQYPHWCDVVNKLVDLCINISVVVLPIVNNLSPEGYIPCDDIQEGEELDETATAQMLLVFAWRTVKEVSLVLGELADRAPYFDCSGREIFENEIVKKITRYYHSIFFQTKHRGAYEQAAVGFCRLCKRLWRYKNVSLQMLPSAWIDEILEMLQSKEDDEKLSSLCATRRSAGLPFMILAILTTEPTIDGNTIFEKCIKTLLSICSNPDPANEKALTHSMNILRAIYRHTQLGELVTPYIEEGMKIAINGFSSSTWGVRNSSTLLFSALMIRIFGVQRNKDSEDMSLKNMMTARVFFMRYPALFNFMLAKLKDATYGTADSLSVHPVLLILARLYPTNVEDEQQLIQYLPLVNICLRHCQYRTRELAAKASISLIPRKHYINYVAKLLLDLSDITLTNNHCQGLILQMLALLKRIPKNTGVINVSMFMENTLWIIMTAGQSISHITAALYMDMVVQLTDTFLNSCFGKSIFFKMGELLLWKAIHERHYEYPVMTGGHQYKRNRLLLLLQVVNVICESVELLKSLFIKEFMCLCIDSEDVEVTEFVLDFIHCLYMEHPFYIKSPLYILEVVDFPDEVNTIVRKLTKETRLSAGKKLHGVIDQKIMHNFSYLMNRTKSSPVKIFTVLQHFVCTLPYLKNGLESTLTYLLKWSHDCDDMIVCAALGCINMLLHHSVDREIKKLNLCDLIKTVIYYASPVGTVHERLAVCQFLKHNNALFSEAQAPTSISDRIQFWNAVIILLEDNEIIIRDTISTLATDLLCADSIHAISEKAREELSELMMISIPIREALCLLLFWSIRKQYNPTPDDEGDDSASKLTEVLFDKGELNTYAEDESLSAAALLALRKHLWILPESLSYADNSIFVGEHAFLVASELFNAIFQTKEALFPLEARIIFLCVLKKMMKMLVDHPVNDPNFSFTLENTMIQEVINATFQKDKNPLKHTAADRFKYVFRRMFNIEEEMY